MTFPAAEFRGRIARMQAEIAVSGIDALLLTTAPDIFYVTGFLTRFWESPARPWFVLVPGAGDPVAVIPAIGEDLMRRTWLTDIRTWASPNPADEGVTLLADAIAGLVPRSGRLGVPMGTETHLRMPLGDYLRLVPLIAPRNVVDGTAPLHRTREIKTAAEAARLREVCQIAARAFARVPEIAGPGQPLDGVFRGVQALCLQEGADWVSYVAGGAGQGGYGDVISPAEARPLVQGDLLMLDTGAVRGGYFCDFDRNWAIGRADDTLRRAHDTLFAATEAGIDAARPGATAQDVHAAIAARIRADGAEPLGGRLGHGLGISLTEWPSFIPGDHTVLRAGMALTIEPGLQIAPGRIMVHEENILLNDAGPELLSPRAPADLPVLG